MFYGFAMLVVAWAMLVAWVARLAQARNRIVLGWMLAAVVAGALGFCVGVLLVVGTALGGSIDDGLPLMIVFVPPVCTLLPVIALGVILVYSPAKVARRGRWPVHFMDRGPGWISIEADVVRFEWSTESREVRLDQVVRVEADGECVRIECAGEPELAALPMSKPETPAGRKQQSAVLAEQLRARPPQARVVAGRGFSRRT